jgi:hypothetical protein
MIEQIGTGKSGAPLVLAELDLGEQTELAGILHSAAQDVAGYSSNFAETKRQMIRKLGRAFGIEVVIEGIPNDGGAW